MSGKTHFSTQHSIFHDIQTMPQEELCDQYGIEINEDGSVWDIVEMKTFDDLYEWANYTIENDDDSYESFSKIGGTKYHEDF